MDAGPETRAGDAAVAHVAGDPMRSPDPALETTRAFWNANPCGVRGAFPAQRDQRYAMEPWLPARLREIAARHADILEVGCGQGVDAIEICSSMAQGGRYSGVDYSQVSVESATANADSRREFLRVRPAFATGNAERLALPDASVEAVYSMGVIHHTADPPAAIAEIRRVLRRDGRIYIALYRRYSLKVAVALALRALQAGLDRLCGTERCVYRWIARRASHSRLFGTMFHECFGVPHMAAYSRGEVEALFADFRDVALTVYGPNLGRLSPGGRTPTRFGYFWWIEATK